MDGGQETRKWSEIRGLAVVSLDNGAKVGSVDDFYYDPAAKEVVALRVKTGMFGGSRALPVKAISGLGLDAVTIASEEALVNEKDDEVLSKLPFGESLLTYKVMSESGTVIGTIGNLLLDTTRPTELRLAALEMAGGIREKISGHYHTFDVQHVLRYGQDVMVIADALALELEK